MNLQKTTLFLAIFTSLASSCSKSDLSPLEQLAFKLVVLDKNGEKRTVLEDGMNFSIGLEVTNRSGEPVILDYEDIKHVKALFSKQPDFLAIYRKENEDNSQESVIIGRPYDPITGINFLDNLWTGDPWKLGPSDSQYFILLPWTYNPANQAIPPGDYYSSFHYTAPIKGIEIPIETRVAFKIN